MFRMSKFFFTLATLVATLIYPLTGFARTVSFNPPPRNFSSA